MASGMLVKITTGTAILLRHKDELVDEQQRASSVDWRIG